MINPFEILCISLRLVFLELITFLLLLIRFITNIENPEEYLMFR